jgi:putative flippase GtrA
VQYNVQAIIELIKGHWREILAFAIVGISATSTHYFTALMLIEWFHVDLHLANFWGFSAAFGVSYLGQSIFTFKSRLSWPKLVKYFILAVSNYFISAMTLEFLSNYLNLSHRIALLIVVMLLPLMSYFISKKFIFKS